MTIYFDLSEGNKKVSIRKLELIANHYKHMANVLCSNEVQALVKKWEGKKYTKRFETALKNIDKNFSIYAPCYNSYLTFCFSNNRSIQLENGCSVYVKGEYIVDSIKSNKQSESGNVKEDLHKLLIIRAKEYQRKFERINNQLSKLDEYIDKFNKIKDAYNELEHVLDYEILDEFNLYLNRR